MTYLLLTISTLLTQWLFAPESVNHVMPLADDTVWQSVSVPHDWAITTPFDRRNDLQQVAVIQNGESIPTWKTGRSGGLNWMGSAWYTCSLPVAPSEVADSVYYVLFDGAMSRAEVYADGAKITEWQYGYNSFVADLTASVRQAQNEGRDNVQLAVRLTNLPEQSRWYPGAGIFRNVHWIRKHRVHIPIWGQIITTVAADSASAILNIHTSVTNASLTTSVATELLYAGVVVATMLGTNGEMHISLPHLWSPETPYLYDVRTRVYDDGVLTDTETTPFGIRSAEFVPGRGFVLNGVPRKFKGVCLHHDLGPLGAAVSKDAIRHQLTLLKNMGCDAVRTAHNIPAPELVALCEQMGLMVVMEAFDVWNWAKCKNDYSTFFRDWSERDLTNMIMRYRNSPAVVMWSVGNEVWDQVKPDGPAEVRRLQDICHRLDPTRPVTCGNDAVKDVICNGFAEVLDIPGFNYRTSRYMEAHHALPEKLLLGTETASTVSSRGVYHYPVIMQPDAIHADKQSSGYDVEYCAWSGLPEQDFQLQDDYPWTIGQFVWTGMDYLGEPSPYDTDAWPAHSSYFGILDWALLPKDRYYLYRSQWNTVSPTLHVLPHWTHKGREGKITPVYVYTSYPQAELFVNGRSHGRLRFATAEETVRLAQGEQISGVSAMPQVGTFDVPEWGSAPRPELLPRYRLMWHDVRYRKGTIKVVAFDENGSRTDSVSIRTAGRPVRLQAEITNVDEATEEGVVYVTVRAVDKHGTLCPDADCIVSLEAENASFMGAANGDPTCLYPVQQPRMPLFHGQATFIVRTNGQGRLMFRAGKMKECVVTLK